MSILLNARVMTVNILINLIFKIQSQQPLVFLNYLSLEDYFITRLKEKTSAYKSFKQDYEDKTTKYEEPEKAKKLIEESAQSNLQETIASSKNNVEVSHNYIAGLKVQIYFAIYKRIAQYRQMVYNNIHDNLPIIYPLVTVGSFFAPVLMTRACELFIYGRFAVFLYDLWNLKKSGQISTRSEDITYGISTVAIFSLVAFTGLVPFYRFLSFNSNNLKNIAAREVMLAEQAKRQLQNLK